MLVVQYSAHSQTLTGEAATDDAAGTDRLPAVRTRISVRWGGLWFDGLVTAFKKELDAKGRDATESHVLYDVAHAAIGRLDDGTRYRTRTGAEYNVLSPS